MDMDFIGEHLLPGQLGHFFIVLSLVASLVATFAYYKTTTIGAKKISTQSFKEWLSGWVPGVIYIVLVVLLFMSGIKFNVFNHSISNVIVNILLKISLPFLALFLIFQASRKTSNEDEKYWKNLARIAFVTESISVLAVFSILFYIIHNHLFEYHYAWKHSSRSLEFKYLLACFWEGQEGSFMLWSFWHCVLGLVLIATGKKWEAPVMTVISFMQFCLATMIAGIYIFGWKMGANPFILLRDSGVLDNAPALHINMDVNDALRPDYLMSIKDGNDLNPLLQNYWMVIHPPVLFMGFASTIVPFAFAIAGLWKKQFGEWTKAALPWALFSAAVFGVGIMMGAKWAYESLTFGGYWAWDPVENASLVPWLILIAGIHTLLIYKHSGHSLRATHLFFILSFGFVLYSTFLTRSGILGETSVHAFTDLGMNFQLLSFLLVFVLPALIFFFIRYKEIPSIQKEENASSREFWMFIGSLVFVLSALVIIGKTSLPVLNKILGTKFAPPEDAEFAYNSIQVYVAVIIGLLTAITQYLKYKETSASFFWKKILIPTIIAAIVATLILLYGNINYDKKGPVFLGSIWLAVACSVYTIIANLAYLWLGIKGKLKLSGGSISHFGFGMVLLGILIASSKKEVLSNNINGIPALLDKNEDPRENLTLVKGLTSDMGKYTLTYIGDSSHPKKQLSFYKIHFKSKDGKEEFTLTPNSFVNYKGNEGLMSNPDARHYWNHDVFTYITSIANPDNTKDTAKFKTTFLKPGDSLFYSNGFIVLQDVSAKDSVPNSNLRPTDTAAAASLRVYSKNGTSYPSNLLLIHSKSEVQSYPDTIVSESIILQLQKVNANNSVELGIKESNAIMQYVTIKAYKFPFINLIWFGVLVTAMGILMSMIRRISLNRKPA